LPVSESSRRKPQQARSRATVDRILDAGARILTTDGYHNTSTNRVAAAAGISPGSLYRYFADKDEIVAEIAHRLVADFGRELSSALRLATSAPRQESTRIVIEAVLDALARHRELLQAIADRVAPAEQPSALRDLRTRVTDAVYLMLLKFELGTADDPAIEHATWFIAELTQHLSVRYTIDAPPIPRDVFVATLVHAIEAVHPG
jgi:AcrR family transcriptional regulator